MNDHHFSYPVVVPLGAMTISGHSSNPAPSLGSPQTPSRVQTVDRHASTAPQSPAQTTRQLAWR
jgi:hypothetical protein